MVCVLLGEVPQCAISASIQTIYIKHEISYLIGEIALLADCGDRQVLGLLVFVPLWSVLALPENPEACPLLRHLAHG